ncbi:response regulator [Geomesophilobacter sediminis]|uniref:histidine kinase n=1 Tax=Geomesophilobacter sediminis TaxID=2798584 RepID=A0A8J7JEM3_9BACT|nr:response regulator [Geomesophilobacter sediminis]MBJ6724554.1 response regulator [Geomesophilobacter sediminis]
MPSIEKPDIVSILVVEDDASSREVLRDLLLITYPTVTVYATENGASGLEYYQSHSPDIVITDVAMPALDGLTMAEKILAVDPGANIIVVTAYNVFDDLHRAIRIGISQFLLKPIDAAKLFATIEKIRDAKREAYERKLLEEAVTRQHHELILANTLLEDRVRERTAELEAAVREQEAFNYAVSHDLRAPLRHLNSYSALIAEELGEHLSGPAGHFLNRIQTASVKMGMLIDSLLELSRLSRTQVIRQEVNLTEVARAISSHFQEDECERQVVVHLQEDLIVKGDPVLLTQLVTNLFSNAWKYTSMRPQGEIQFRRTRIEGGSAFCMKDNGIGFDPAFKERLFQPFERLHNFPDLEGVGIGLATVQRIVKRHGGNVWAEGEVDRGAAFYFTIPDVPA